MFDLKRRGSPRYLIADRASGGYPPRRANLVSAMNIQVQKWNQIIRQLRQWGVKRSTIRNEQPQVVSRPRVVRDSPAGRRRVQRDITANNQPDIQAIDPRSGRRINIEVDVNPREFERKIGIVVGNDPNARSVFLLIDREDGRVREKRVYDPLLRRTSRVHDQELQRRDVLDFDSFSDMLIDDLIDVAETGLFGFDEIDMASPIRVGTKCTEHQHNQLYGKVKQYCKGSGGYSCSQVDSSQHLDEKLSRAYGCETARSRYQDKCFYPRSPGWEGHERQISEVNRAIRNCRNIIRARI